MNWVLIIVLSGPLGIREVEHRRFGTGEACMTYLNDHALEIWKTYPLSIGQRFEDIKCVTLQETK